MPARYTLQNHPAFGEPLSKEDLQTLVARGALARGEMCVDEETGLTHTVGELISGMRHRMAQSRLNRPAYREISPDHEILTEEERLTEEEIETAQEDDDEDEHSYTPSGEIILHHAHPSWLGYAKALFLVPLLLASSGLLFTIHQFEYAVIALLCGCSTLIAVGIARYSHDYIVTRERVELIWGIIGRSSKEARICDIRSIDVYESGLKGLLGLGTINFSTAANAGIEVQFKNMRRAHEVKDLVRKLQRSGPVTDD
jgi:membrane protein YdbS with pleckstrin-like domain